MELFRDFLKEHGLDEDQEGPELYYGKEGSESSGSDDDFSEDLGEDNEAGGGDFSGTGEGEVGGDGDDGGDGEKVGEFKDRDRASKKGRDKRFMSPEEKAEEKLSDFAPGEAELVKTILEAVGSNLKIYNIPTLVAAARWNRSKRPNKEFKAFCDKEKVKPADTFRYGVILSGKK